MKEIFFLKYAPEDINNADEAGLFFNFCPEHWNSKGENAMVVKIQNRCWHYFCVQIAPVHIKFRFLLSKPKCLKNVKCLPVEYKTNTEVWMTSKLFSEWLQNLDKNIYEDNEEENRYTGK